jgi:hypothetical protein
MRAAAAVIGVALASAFAVPAGAAPTPIPERYCHSVQVRGGQWGVDGTGPPCRFMRHWTVRWLRDRDHPPGWRCVHLGDGGQCDRRHSDKFFEYYLFD